MMVTIWLVGNAIIVGNPLFITTNTCHLIYQEIMLFF